MPGRTLAQRTVRLDGRLVASLIGLSDLIAGAVESPVCHSLAVRDPRRGNTTALPSGESFARVVGAEPLSGSELEHTWPHGTL